MISMFKMRTAAILVLALLLSLAPAALAEIDPVELAKSNLTEVYGYTAEEAETFRFAVQDAGDVWKVRFSPENHSWWSYELEVDKATGSMLRASTPFASDYDGYPGQNSVQDVLRTARENDWFRSWDASAMKAFRQKLIDDGHIRMNAELDRGLATGEIGAAQAIDGFFRSCYGNPAEWASAVLEWRNDVLEEYGLILNQATEQPMTDGVRSYQTNLKTGAGTGVLAGMTVTEFRGEVPPELKEALAHPKLAGWNALCGAYVAVENAPDNAFPVASNGFVALGRGADRLLVMVRRAPDQAAWEVIPVGERALLRNRELSITYEGSASLFCIEYPVSENESEFFRVSMAASALEGKVLCRLKDYRRIRKDTGEGIMIDGERNGARDDWYHLTIYEKGQPPKEVSIDALTPTYLDFINADAFPKSEDECRAITGYGLPDGYGVAGGVHLRKKTSSRSTDLGEYYSGTLVNVLELLPGNPSLWAHVRVGQTEGYMSGVYVNYDGTECSMQPLEQHAPLPVAKTRKELALKKGTGWLDGTAAKLPAGTKMHVMGVCGDWLHVMVPQRDEPGWLMDVNGTDGYVKATDVVQAATAVQLDWLE